MGISQETLAERADVHRTYVSDVERGARNVSLETIDRLASALEISISALFMERRGQPAGKSETRFVASDELVDILLVEDNPDDATLTLKALKRASMANRIQLVGDGAAALDFIFCRGKYSDRRPEDLPQMILLDLNLPKINGLEVLRRIRDNPRTQSIPVVVLTVSSRGQDLAASQRLGAQAYIVKPVDFHNFSEVIPKLKMHWAVLKPAAMMAA